MSESATLVYSPTTEQEIASGIERLEEMLAQETALHLPEQPKAMEAASLPIEEAVQARFKQRFLGAIGLHEIVEFVQPEETGPTLATAISRAAEGDPEANALVDINIATAAAEGCFKDDYVGRVAKAVDASGEIRQFGLNLHQTHYNSYTLRSGRPAELQEFTLVEALNGYREQKYLEEGLLDDYILVVASCVPTDLPEKALDQRGDGYFTRTMAYGLQGTTRVGDEVVTETAFRRSTTAPEDASYEERQSKRIDLKAIGMVYEWLGFEAPKTPLEFLQRPLLLKKSEFPNGIVDVLRRCDIASDVLQDVVKDRTEADYQLLIAESARKDASLAGIRAAVKQDLLAAAGTFKEHEEANHLLWELIRKHAVPAAGTNRAIDAIAFGPIAAVHIEEARQADAVGDFRYRDELLELALEFATVAGCGGGACGLEDVDPATAEWSLVSSLLDLQPGETMLRDTKRPCKNKKCGRIGGVYYVYNEEKANSVKKGCIYCGVKEVHGKRQDQDESQEAE